MLEKALREVRTSGTSYGALVGLNYILIFPSYSLYIEVGSVSARVAIHILFLSSIMGVIKLRGRPLYTLMKIICGTSFMMYGYDAGVLGGMLLHKPFLDAMGNPTGDYTIPMVCSHPVPFSLL